MGYQTAAENVSDESGFDLESPTVAAFRSSVLQGAWDETEKLLNGATTPEEQGEPGNGLVLAVGSDRSTMRFWVRQQKYLELLEQRDTARALMALRNDLTPLSQDTEKLRLLSSLLMCRSTDDLMAKANWDGAHGRSRHRLLSELSSAYYSAATLAEPAALTWHRMYITFRHASRNPPRCSIRPCEEEPDKYLPLPHDRLLAILVL